MQIGQAVARVGQHQLALGGIDQRVLTGDEHVRRDVGMQSRINPRQHGGRLLELMRGLSEEAACGGHDQCRGHAFVCDIADDDRYPATRQRHEVVEVTTHLTCRAIVGAQLPPRQRRQLGRQEVLLDEPSNPEFLVDALALADLIGLALNELAKAKHRSGGCRQPVEQPKVVWGVGTIRLARTEAEHANQLALADQGHGYDDTLLA